MAQGIRPRQRLAAGAALAAGALNVLSVTSCGERTAAAPVPRTVATAGLSAEALVDAVLAECHERLRGTLDRVVATLRLPGGEELELFAELPDRVRVQGPGLLVRVLSPAQSFALRDQATAPLDADDRRQLTELRALLDAATFGPLYRAAELARTDTGVRVVTREGAAWTVVLQHGTLLPASLAGPDGAFRITGWRRTSMTWIPEQVEAPTFGACTIRFRGSDFGWAPGFFAPPAAGNGATVAVLPGDGTPKPRPERPAVPTPGRNRPAQWIVVDDPGDWEQRAAVYGRHAKELQAQGQQLAGFAGFQQEGARACMIIPFRQRPDGKPFAAPAGWEIRSHAATAVLEVYPKGTDVDAMIADGAALLQRALADQHLEAAGPIQAQPFFPLDEGPPDSKRLAAPVVRMSVPLR